MRPSSWHVIVLIVVVLIIFGAPRLPSIAKNIGQSLKIFKKEVQELSEDDKNSSPKTPDNSGTTHQD